MKLPEDFGESRTLPPSSINCSKTLREPLPETRHPTALSRIEEFVGAEIGTIADIKSRKGVAEPEEFPAPTENRALFSRFSICRTIALPQRLGKR